MKIGISITAFSIAFVLALIVSTAIRVPIANFYTQNVEVKSFIKDILHYKKVNNKV